jgi:amidohydrolase
MNLQTIVSRTLSPLESGVVSVTAISAGDAFNVIPATAVIKGTVRALSTEMLMDLRDKVEHITKSTAALYGCSSTISYSPDYYPPTVNDAELFKWSKDVGAIVSKEGYLRDIEPSIGGEDFAFLAEVIPSTFFLDGQGSGGDEKYHMPRTDYGLHHPSFALDEEVLPIGVELHANLALRSIKKFGS